MSENLTSRILIWLSAIPILGIFAELLLHLQHILWRKKPRFIQRLSDFLPIGGLSTLLQAVTLFVLLKEGEPVIVATIVAVEMSALFNFTANRFITWKERFDGLSRRQSIVWFLPLFVVFNLTTPTVFIKIIGLNSLQYFLGIPILASWLLFEVMGTVLNYIGADKISFGTIAYVIRWICKNSADSMYQTVEGT